MWGSHNRFYFQALKLLDENKEKKQKKVFFLLLLYLLHLQFHLHPWRTVISRFKIQYQVRHRLGGRGESTSLPWLYLIARPSQNLWTFSQKNSPCSQLHEELNIFWLYWNIFRIIFLCWHPLLSAFMVNNDQ